MMLNQLRQLCRDRFHDYVVFKKEIFFILGLILSYKLVKMTFLNILITHLSDASKDYDLRRANAVVNLQEGTSAVLVTFFAYAADVYTGRFKMVVFSTTVCIIGLLLSWLAAGNNKQLDLRLFYPALGLMTLAKAALTVTLRAFLDDQLRPTDSSPGGDDDDDEARRRRSKFWWVFVSFVAAILAMFVSHDLSKLALELTAVMGVFFLLFLLGSKYYNLVGRIQNPFKDVGIVILGAIAMRKVEYPQTQEGYFLQTQEGLFDDSNGDVHILPHVPWLRWLDKAAIKPAVPASSVEQVRRVKFLLKMLPLWSCFLTFSLVVASGSTFFLEEATSLVPDDDLRPILFTILQGLTVYVVSVISSFIIKKLRERKQYNDQKIELVRIGVGMSCCVPCCIAAWATATLRQHGNMSVYLLTPQYLLLGLMGGLSQEGLQSFYESQVPASLSRYGPQFGEFMMGVGKFLSILCILILSTRRLKWFDNDISNSRFSNYYILLAVLSFGNFIIYCLVARWYGDDTFLLEDVVPNVEMGTARTVSRPDSGDVVTEIFGSDSGSKQEEKEDGDDAFLLEGVVPDVEMGTARTVSRPDSGDVITEISGSKQEEREDEEEEEEEDGDDAFQEEGVVPDVEMGTARIVSRPDSGDVITEISGSDSGSKQEEREDEEEEDGDDAFQEEGVVPDVEMGVAHQDDGLASRYNEGHHISLQTLFHRTVSKQEDKEVEEETPEEKPLTNKNHWKKKLLQLRGVTMFLRLLARRRAKD